MLLQFLSDGKRVFEFGTDLKLGARLTLVTQVNRQQTRRGVR